MANSRKIILIIIAVVIILILALAVALYFASQSGAPSVSTNTGNAISTPLPSAPADIAIPAGDTISLGTLKGVVTVKNFYKNVIASEDEFLILASTTEYQITYDTVRNAFYIGFSEPPSAILQQNGEAALIELLGINPADACKFDVAEGFSGNFAGSRTQQLGFSFCTGGAFQNQ